MREEREKSLRLERELDNWKGMRMERGSVHRSGTLVALSDADARSRRGSSIGPPSPAPFVRASTAAPSTNGDVAIEVPQRKSSLSKGFL